MENENQNACGCCHKKIWLKALGMVIIGAIVIVALVRERIIDDSKNTVTIIGHGKISYNPKEATITLGAEVNNVSTSSDALSNLNQKVSKIIDAVTAQGIAREDIATQNYSLNPHYDYNNGKSTVLGYDANQQITVKIKDVGQDQKKVSDVLTAAGNAGSTDVRNVTYGDADTTDLLQQAKIAAIEDARKKSQALAQAAGVKLGKVLGWQEHDTNGTFTPYMDNSLAAASPKSIAPADVPAGTKDITVDVDVKFEIK